MDARALGLLIVAGGVALVVVGLMVMGGALSWFGRLPGDLRFEGEHTRVFVPFTSMRYIEPVVVRAAPRKWIFTRRLNHGRARMHADFFENQWTFIGVWLDSPHRL